MYFYSNRYHITSHAVSSIVLRVLCVHSSSLYPDTRCVSIIHVTIYLTLIAHLAEGQESIWYGATSVRPSSVRRQLFPLNDFFSRTTRPISPKLGRKRAWRTGIQLCSNTGAGPFWGPIGGNIRKIFINLEKSSHEPLAGMH